MNVSKSLYVGRCRGLTSKEGQPDDLISAEKNTEGPTQKRRKKKRVSEFNYGVLKEFIPLTFPRNLLTHRAEDIKIQFLYEKLESLRERKIFALWAQVTFLSLGRAPYPGCVTLNT